MGSESASEPVSRLHPSYWLFPSDSRVSLMMQRTPDPLALPGFLPDLQNQEGDSRGSDCCLDGVRRQVEHNSLHLLLHRECQAAAAAATREQEVAH